MTRIEMQTSHGLITLELDEERAPLSCANFCQYARDGHYDGTIFHRVIDGFMIQGGGFGPDMQTLPTREPVRNEADNKLKNEAGAVAMARTPDPHSATAQFFINVADNKFLNHTAQTSEGWGYCVFAKVVDGMSVVEKIAKVSTTASGMHQDVPAENVVIEKVVLAE